MPDEVRPRLHVEGPDDLNSIANLVEHYGIALRANPSAPEIKAIGSVEKLIDGIETAVEVSTDRIIGFVIDADSPLSSRWESVRQRLVRAGVDGVPEKPVDGGFIGESRRYRSRVGVWLMPDNLQDGTLEQFLFSLIDEKDSVIAHAESSTDVAKQLGAIFREVDRPKAVIHAWLAWQEAPGRPYGVAIKAKYFRHDTPSARLFVTWYAQLYGLQVDIPA